MPLVSLKLPKKTKKELAGECCPEPMQEEYPWGTRLTLQKEQLEKLPDLSAAQAGDMVGLECLGKIVEVRISDKNGSRERHTVEIQIQQMGTVKPKKKPRAASLKEVMTEITTSRSM